MQARGGPVSKSPLVTGGYGVRISWSVQSATAQHDPLRPFPRGRTDPWCVTTCDVCLHRRES